MQNQIPLVFISHSPKDVVWRNRLQTMLAPLVNTGAVYAWDNSQILPGWEIRQAINQALASAKVAVLLVSADFFDSNWQEFQLFLDAAKRNNLRIIWVYVRACLYDLTALKDYQAAHDITKPLNSLLEAEQDQILLEICQQIASAVNNTSIGIVKKQPHNSADANHASIGIVDFSNPFVPLNGKIEDVDRLFGREREIKRVFELLNTGTSVALIGEKQVGKSSLLQAVYQQAERKLNQQRKPVYLNLGNVDDEEDFYFALCDQIGIELCKGYKLRKELKKHRLLLILDEVEKMAWNGFTNNLRGQIRALANGENMPLRLVIAARSPLHELFDDSEMTSPFENICYEETINPWDVTMMRNFIVDRLAVTPIRFSEEEIVNLLASSGGNPWKLMNGCHRLFYEKTN